GPISGPGGLSLQGSGTLALAHANNSFAGAVSLGGAAPTLRLDADNAVPATATVDFSNSGTETLVVNNHAQTLDSLIGQGNLNLPTVGSVLSITNSIAGGSTFSATVTGAGEVRYVGSSALFVNTSSNNFAGKFVASSGRVRFSGSTSGGVSALAGARFEISNPTSALGPVLGNGGTIAMQTYAPAT